MVGRPLGVPGSIVTPLLAFCQARMLVPANIHAVASVFTVPPTFRNIWLSTLAGGPLLEKRAPKDLPERTVVYRHALRNAMIPILTVLGLQFGALLAGAIVTETIFSWPGIGRLTIQAIANRDYYLVQGCILAIGLTYVAVNFLTDLLYSAVNPRIKQ
jgi:ABC-type dipeptide/oligopeptide/nickel transport system permease component